ncbi:uncharacterized protein METZ01_LOCUS501403, partial [marine metagenome]
MTVEERNCIHLLFTFFTDSQDPEATTEGSN